MPAALPPPPPRVRLRLLPADADAEDGGISVALSLVTERAQLALEEQADGSVTAALAVVELQEELGGGGRALPSASTPAQLAGPAEPAPAPADEHPAAHPLRARHAQLLAENAVLQARVRAHLDGISKASRKSLQEATPGQQDSQQQQRYELALQQLRKLAAQKEAAATAAAEALAPATAAAAAAQADADTRRAAFLRFVADVGAACAAAAAAGAPRAALPDAALQAFLAAEPAAAAECRALRAGAAGAAARLAAADARLRARDSLSSQGLHLVDFEQLRIEAAGLGAKREARQAEADKLRARLAQAVQITAHVREKLHCTEQQREALAAQLAGVEGQLGAARAELTSSKAARDAARRRREGLAQDWRIVADRRCLDDYAAQRERLAGLQARAAELRARWEQGAAEAAAGGADGSAASR